ncbi:hypothetical protein J6590_014457 [Homalodisca vitripennis]|nr:hypothetical protein J6590_014457 [Homalodisca vitripennis]
MDNQYLKKAVQEQRPIKQPNYRPSLAAYSLETPTKQPEEITELTRRSRISCAVYFSYPADTDARETTRTRRRDRWLLRWFSFDDDPLN